MDDGKTNSGDSKTSDFSAAGPIGQSPEKVEEFQIREVLGRGGFGTVYLAYDTTLEREVALKIPHPRLVGKASTASSYLAEARAIARLDHPYIIPVYRAASTPEIPCYIVTKRIVGCHLGVWRARQQPSFRQLAEVVAKVAEALAYAHRCGVVHRDIKPGNVLIDQANIPFVADFGLALREIVEKDGPTYVGTPAYMSPEQARGEGHRVDGRSDVFSLGVVLYELLTGKRPFPSSDRSAVLEEILFDEPELPRQIDSSIPRELSRICLKALSKPVGERYQDAAMLAADLESFVRPEQLMAAKPSIASITPGDDGDVSETHEELSEGAGISGAGISHVEQRVVPKGLRAFDMRDADFFLRLLPGPRDRDGIPEIIRFWTSNLTPGRLEQPLSIGLIYGPSGCGKTSLVRAGLIPRLPRSVHTIYVQATATGTEEAILQQLTSRAAPWRDLPFDETTDIAEAFATLRRAKRARTVVFIDQFEQWLFAHPDGLRESLTQALRQCDGEYLQCVLMVRDDFWMGVTRLMQSLDLTIAENVNATAVDLFDARHARQVLAMFGAAYGRLPDSQDELTASQDRFLDEAVRYLSSEGRVICVQLALLTEMLKNGSWNKSTRLLADGGAEVGMRFFEETFDSESSPRRIRIHAEGTRRIFRALMPEPGTRIKGSTQTEAALFRASGYRDRAAFRDLISILDRELHLITPTDRLDDDSISSDSTSSAPQAVGFQLTHDFLIAPIRQWMEYHARTTKQGKARLRLEEFAQLYLRRPRPQSLPTFMEYLSIRRYCGTASYTDPQQRMMDAAVRRNVRMLSLWSLGMLAVSIVGVAIAQGIRRQNARLAGDSAIARLLDAQLPEAVKLATTLRGSTYAEQAVTNIVEDTRQPLSQRVRGSLVLENRHPEALQLLTNYALSAPVEDVVVISKSLDLAPLREGRDALRVWQTQSESRAALIRAACVLANDPLQIQYLQREEDLRRLLELLLAENPAWIKSWSIAFQPLREELTQRIVRFLQTPRREASTLNAVNLLVEFAPLDAELLAAQLPIAQAGEVAVLAEAIRASSRNGLKIVRTLLDAESAPGEPIDVTLPWGSPWWVTGPRQPLTIDTPLLEEALDRSLQVRLEDYEAVIGPHAVLIHKLPPSELAELQDALETSNYRVAEVIPYTIGEQRFLTAMWLRDGIAARQEFDLTAEQLRTVNEQHRMAGFIPDSVSAYYLTRDAEGRRDVRYACTWLQLPPDSEVIDGDLYVDIPGDDHETEGWGKMRERGLPVPRCNLRMLTPSNEERYTSVRWNLKNGQPYQDDWDTRPEDLAKRQALARSATLLTRRWNLAAGEPTPQRLSPLWWVDVPVDVRDVPPLPRREHLRAAATLLAEGFYPVSIDVGPFIDETTPAFCSTWWRGRPAFSQRVARSNRRRNLQMAMLMLGDTQKVEAAMNGEGSPELRGGVIAAHHQFALPVDWLLERLRTADASLVLRRSCAMALSLYRPETLTKNLLRDVADELPALYESTNDPGLRSAIQIMADKWGLDFQPSTVVDPAREVRSVAGDRLVVITPKNPVWMGSPPEEPGRDGTKERLTPIVVDRSYAIATTEVTVAQYQAFQPSHKVPSNYAVSTDCPVVVVNWFDAARYCRWLSEQEGLPESEMCYPPVEDIQPGLQIPADFTERIGYRLPTEAEWEYASRGGSESGRWFGFDTDRLQDHAWTAVNANYQLHPVGQRLPNDYGLFDMLGNSMEWCHGVLEEHAILLDYPLLDPGNRLLTLQGDTRMASRGGSTLYQPLDARASQRNFHLAGDTRVYITFRISRTIRSP